jgi:hypothetical protein
VIDNCIFVTRVPEPTCSICNKPQGQENIIYPTAKGRDTILQASESMGASVKIANGDFVHVACRRNFTNKKNIQIHLNNASSDTSSKRSSRSTTEQFDFQNKCFFCSRNVDKTSKTLLHAKDVWYTVRTLECQATIQDGCNKRKNDDWAHVVRARLESIKDLVAADAVYHTDCKTRFLSNKRPREESETPKAKHGRPKNEQMADTFEKIACFLEENDDEQVTVNDLIKKMKEISGENIAYSHLKMVQELQKRFGEDLIIAQVDGKANVVTCTKTPSSILHSFYAKQSSDEEAQKVHILKTAAELIKSDIKSVAASRDIYPSQDDIESLSLNLEFVPESLRLMLSIIFCGKSDLKIASVGQVIMQAARPRMLLCPLPFGLGVQVHHLFASKHMNETLHALGFAPSYDEIRTYEIDVTLILAVSPPHPTPPPTHTDCCTC